MQAHQPVDEAVEVSVPLLVQLGRLAATLPLGADKILARQSGDYQSPFRGRGMEFDESRLYQPGDDIRNIDWRVTARSGKTHTKLFREERERQVFVWVDLRPNMFFATRGSYKAVIAARMASLLAWSAIHHGDRIGGVVFSDDVHHELKPQRGKQGVLRLINQVANHPTWIDNQSRQRDRTALLRSLVRLRRVARPGSLIFLLSDFRDLDKKFESQLILLSRHAEIVMVYIHDRLEQALPPAGFYRVSNGEQELVLDTFDKARTSSYHEHFLQHHTRLQRLARNSSVHLIDCLTEQDPLAVLQTGLRKKTSR